MEKKQGHNTTWAIKGMNGGLPRVPNQGSKA